MSDTHPNTAPISTLRTEGPAPADVADLAKSIAEVGLLEPILITPDYEVIAGRDRLEACRQLDWTDIPVSVTALTGDQLELARLDSNLVRKELTVLERAELLARREAIYIKLHPKTVRGVAGGEARAAKARGEAIDTVSFAKDAARALKKSTRTIERHVGLIKEIPPDLRETLAKSPLANRYSDLKRIAGMKEPQQRRVVEAIAGGAKGLRAALVETMPVSPPEYPTTGGYQVVVLDPPWQDRSQRAPYPTMTLDEIKGMPIEDVAAGDAVVWVWTTNSMLVEAHECIREWGFETKTMLTWVKHRPTPGHWLYDRTEHCLLAARGKPQLALARQTTVVEGKVREHSRKPDEFYALVEALTPGAKRLDMFAREQRTGWDAWGNEPEFFGQQAAE